MIDYRSDNTGRAAPQISEALLRANPTTALGYGADEWTASLQQRFSELFETTVRVFPVATGTAANALALASLGPSWGIVYCSEVAHINTSEANAAAFFGGGIKLAAIGGQHGKINADLLAEALAGISPAQLHRGRPIAVSLTQATDLGAVYTLDEIRAIAEVAKAAASSSTWTARFANAVAQLGCSLADRPGARASKSCRLVRRKTVGRCATRSLSFRPTSPTVSRSSYAAPAKSGRKCASPRPS
jgi:threonine aldolase